MAARPELFAGSLTPEMRKLLDGLNDLTGRLGLLTDRLEDSLDSDPAPDPAAGSTEEGPDDRP